VFCIFVFFKIYFVTTHVVKLGPPSHFVFWYLVFWYLVFWYFGILVFCILVFCILVFCILVFCILAFWYFVSYYINNKHVQTQSFRIIFISTFQRICKMISRSLIKLITFKIEIFSCLTWESWRLYCAPGYWNSLCCDLCFPDGNSLVPLGEGTEGQTFHG